MSTIKHYFDVLKQTCTEIADRDSFLYAIKRMRHGKRDGEYCLAQIYEDGNSFVRRDLASAYALYYLAAEKGLLEAHEHLAVLKPTLMADEWARAKAAIQKLRQGQMVFN